jgi:hypothetical protein
MDHRVFVFWGCHSQNYRFSRYLKSVSSVFYLDKTTISYVQIENDSWMDISIWRLNICSHPCRWLQPPQRPKTIKHTLVLCSSRSWIAGNWRFGSDSITIVFYHIEWWYFDPTFSPYTGLLVSRIPWKFQLKTMFPSWDITAPKVTHIHD